MKILLIIGLILIAVLFISGCVQEPSSTGDSQDNQQPGIGTPNNNTIGEGNTQQIGEEPIEEKPPRPPE